MNGAHLWLSTLLYQREEMAKSNVIGRNKRKFFFQNLDPCILSWQCPPMTKIPGQIGESRWRRATWSARTRRRGRRWTFSTGENRVFTQFSNPQIADNFSLKRNYLALLNNKESVVSLTMCAQKQTVFVNQETICSTDSKAASNFVFFYTHT